MYLSPRKCPFPASVQFRDAERSGLESFFERAFFDTPYSSQARDALLRTRVDLTQNGAGKAPEPPAAPAGESGGRKLDQTTDFLPADSARYVLLYRGESGVGKTRIFQQLRESARKRRIPVYEVFHRDVEGIPFKPLLRAIRAILRDHDRSFALQEKYRYGLQRLLPELYAGGSEAKDAGDASDAPATGETSAPDALSWNESEKIKIFDAVTQLLMELTVQKPLLILVHDLHWSDRPTIELLEYIGRNVALRNARLSPFTPRRAGGTPALRGAAEGGPEVDGFEAGGWRALTRRRPGSLDGAHLPPAAAGDADDFPARPGDGRLEAGEEAQQPAGPSGAGPRLVILGNYRAFPDSSHYLEGALRRLASQSFAYHGELLPLGRDEVGGFVQRSIQGVETDGRPLEVSAEAVDAIHEGTEGFPSFSNELFRALYLKEGPLAQCEGAPHVWSAERIRRALMGYLAPPAAGEEDEGQPGPEAGEDGGQDAPPAPQAKDSTDAPEAPSYPSPPPRESFPLSRRHAILRLRLAASAPLELDLLKAVAVAMRPITCSLMEKVLDGAPEGGDDRGAAIEEALEALVARGILDRYAASASGETGETGGGVDMYFFRLWDYVLVVEERIDETEERRLHRKIAEAFLPRLDAEGDEVAYEVYYHFRRGPDPRSSIPYGFMAAERFLRTFALEKARRVYASLLDLLTTEEDLKTRIDLLEQSARVGLALKDGDAAAQLVRRAQADGTAVLSPERKIDLILLEADAACLADPAKGLKILGKAPRLLKDENSLAGIRVQLATARVRFAREDPKRAINFALKGINICQKVGDVAELGELYRVIAGAFYRKGEYSYAVDNYQRALDVFERVGVRKSLVRALDELGRVYLERGNYFRAARYFYKSLEIRRRQHDIVGLCKSYDALGQVYLRSGDYLRTIENLNRGLTFKERTGDLAGINPTLMVLGDLYLRMGRYEESIFYFNREAENSQRLGDTAGLVDAFKQLGRVQFELGDVKQAERLCKQVGILASEFKLRSYEADGALLEGSLKSLARDWQGAEKCFRFAAEVHGKLGQRRREVCALLSLADTKFERELHDESLKFVSKGQIIADQVKAIDLQVRALTLKGSIYRFLKGGNPVKAREFFQKALELSQSLSDVNPLFQLYSTLARISHTDREYAEASNYYGKAELILKQIAGGLSDDHLTLFFEDGRRKVFAEDLARFRKEAMDKMPGASLDFRAEPRPAAGVREVQAASPDYKDLLRRVLRVHSDLNQLQFHERLLAEALEMTRADRGFVLRVQSRNYFPVAFQGFGKSPEQDPEFVSASNLLEEAIRKGRSWTSSHGEDGEEEQPHRGQKALQFGGLVHRSILAVPFMTEERIFGGIYLDKPNAVGTFVLRDQILLENFARHAAIALNNRRELETAVREPLTGYYTASYFTERLREAYRWFNLHGKSFTLLGYYLPTLEGMLSDGRTQLVSSLTSDLGAILPRDAALCWASPILYVLLEDMDLPAAETLAGGVRDRLTACINDNVPLEVLPVHNRYRHGAEMYFEMRRRLLPEVCDARIIGELRAILADGVSLREAKKILERQKIENTLRKTGGNITHAARELGIHRPQLSNLLKKHSLRREVFENGGKPAAEDDSGNSGD